MLGWRPADVKFNVINTHTHNNNNKIMIRFFYFGAHVNAN